MFLVWKESKERLEMSGLNLSESGTDAAYQSINTITQNWSKSVPKPHWPVPSNNFLLGPLQGLANTKSGLSYRFVRVRSHVLVDNCQQCKIAGLGERA
ncbi:hypothetical protein VNO77_34545 [Canavalia gladiata]|uniref:Uncharacterized protein n=1 Tax=Canavalia gladiata TaxID=3824 RepID=A0AAN9KFP4_CANGL